MHRPMECTFIILIVVCRIRQCMQLSVMAVYVKEESVLWW
jgi:hypothetical protein